MPPKKRPLSTKEDDKFQKGSADSVGSGPLKRSRTEFLLSEQQYDSPVTIGGNGLHDQDDEEYEEEAVQVAPMPVLDDLYLDTVGPLLT
jgi:hypothetical protein